MSNPLLLDTHVWVRFGNRKPRLRQVAVDAMEESFEAGSVFVSVISIWEIAMLVQRGRLVLQKSVEEWTSEALALPGLHLLPFSPQIAIDSVNLPEPMHRDAADRILVASARVERMTLITSDKALLNFAKTTSLAHLRA